MVTWLPAQLLWKVDQGDALDISGLPDAVLLERLTLLLSNLPLRRTKQVPSLQPQCM